MKKHIYLKQLFADDPAPTEEQIEQKDGAGEQKPDKEDPKPDKTEKKYSDEDLDKIIGKRFAKWQQEQEKKISEATKLAEMNAQEKAEYERDQLQKQLDELKQANTRAEMAKTARKMLSDDGLNIPDDLIGMLITDEADGTKSNIEQFSKLFKDAVQDAVKDALKGKAPKKGGSTGVTKEDILKIQNTAERQKAISEHIDLFK